MAAHAWINKIKELAADKLLLAITHKNIKDTIDEIQKNAITSIISSDGSITATPKEGEVDLSTGGAKILSANIQVVVDVQWNNPKLQYTPASLAIKNGLIVDYRESDRVTIDTAEEC